MKWWKILAFIILLYVHIAGLLIPIGVGITNVSPFQVKGGENLELQITTYNADLNKETELEIRSWLKMDDDHLIESTANIVEDRNQLKLNFDLPGYLPADKTSTDLTLIVDIPDQGTPVLPRPKEPYYQHLKIMPGAEPEFPDREYRRPRTVR